MRICSAGNKKAKTAFLIILQLLIYSVRGGVNSVRKARFLDRAKV